jgi:hypothetical protein
MHNIRYLIHTVAHKIRSSRAKLERNYEEVAALVDVPEVPGRPAQTERLDADVVGLYSALVRDRPVVRVQATHGDVGLAGGDEQVPVGAVERAVRDR